ncbi:hypothetical protein F4808DRAFT_475267 [Astrocystis sublimbata]|nr:hypothetical protein F4808DRAFT_475267 [Astrocystis sublimbata]
MDYDEMRLDDIPTYMLFYNGTDPPPGTSQGWSSAERDTRRWRVDKDDGLQSDNVADPPEDDDLGSDHDADHSHGDSLRLNNSSASLDQLRTPPASSGPSNKIANASNSSPPSFVTTSAPAIIFTLLRSMLVTGYASVDGVEALRNLVWSPFRVDLERDRQRASSLCHLLSSSQEEAQQIRAETLLSQKYMLETFPIPYLVVNQDDSCRFKLVAEHEVGGEELYVDGLATPRGMGGFYMTSTLRATDGNIVSTPDEPPQQPNPQTQAHGAVQLLEQQQYESLQQPDPQDQAEHVPPPPYELDDPRHPGFLSQKKNQKPRKRKQLGAYKDRYSISEVAGS